MGAIQTTATQAARLGFLSLVAAALSFPAFGQEFSSQKTPPIVPIVRVHVPDGGGNDVGSGTIVFDDGTKAVVYTNWHVIQGAQGFPIVTTADGRRWTANIFTWDQAHDLAALVIKSPGIRPLDVAFEFNPRDRITIGGYGPNAPLRYDAGYKVNINYTQDGLISIGAYARQGDSGGPAIRPDGKMIGVLWGGANSNGFNEVMITTGRPFYEFHKRVLSPEAQQVNLTRWNCSGGSCQWVGPGAYQGNCSNGQCQSYPSSGSVYTPSPAPVQNTVPRPSVSDTQVQTLYENQVKLESMISSLQKNVSIASVANNSSTCTCEDKWAALDKWKSEIESKLNGFKSCNCSDHSSEITDLSRRIDDLQKRIQDCNCGQSKPTSGVEMGATLEGIITRVPNN